VRDRGKTNYPALLFSTPSCGLTYRPYLRPPSPCLLARQNGRFPLPYFLTAKQAGVLPPVCHPPDYPSGTTSKFPLDFHRILKGNGIHPDQRIMVVLTYTIRFNPSKSVFQKSCSRDK
jgi:hypothetical protein